MTYRPLRHSRTIPGAFVRQEIHKGDTFVFGVDTYTVGRGIPKLSWIILEHEPKTHKLLLLSRQILIIDSFTDRSENSTWATSYARRFLNTDFMREAFTDTLMARICTTDVPNDEKNEFGVSGGTNTKDQIFLLSRSEYYRYRDVIPDNMTIPPYIMIGRFKNEYFLPESEQEKHSRQYRDLDEFHDDASDDSDTRWPQVSARSFFSTVGWWLRTPGVGEGEFMYVDRYSEVSSHGMNGVFAVHGYRPAMWLKF
ncbi:MAG: hypothetical protein IJ523_11515 [Succinivibrionaceae bacterium]|nr:hypothetical protein [Succinivibrionaceae bacterium]